LGVVVGLEVSLVSAACTNTAAPASKNTTGAAKNKVIRIATKMAAP
jgi:hypothetical protein